METNERLVQLIQEGKTEYKEQLWNQCVDFIKYMANKQLANYPEHYGQLFDDMVNQTYLYFDTAVTNYDLNKGKFLTYFNYFIRNAFSEVLHGRTEKRKNDPLNSALSIDKTINRTEDLTIGEMIIDTQSEAYIKAVDDREFWKSVRKLLESAIDEVCEEEYKEFFRTMLDYGTGTLKTMQLLNIDPSLANKYRNAHDRTFVKMRRYITSKATINRYKDPVLNDLISYRTGWRKWSNNRFTSSVELDVIRRIDRQLTARSIVKMYKQ